VSVQCRTERTFSRWKALMGFDFSDWLAIEQTGRLAEERRKTPATIEDLTFQLRHCRR
jgi:hypothetical protein